MIDYATLTGAARVARGPERPALVSNDDALAEDRLEGGSEVTEPLWRLPLWSNYAEMLKSEIADVNNAGEGGMAGAVTAALFLQKFVVPRVVEQFTDVGQQLPFLTRAVIAISGRSEEHTSELQSLMRISYAVFCLKKKNK